MKKTVTRIFSLLAMASAFSAMSQNIRPCGTNEAMEKVFNADPAARARFEAIQSQLINGSEALMNGRSSATEYTIPVVFHVLHTGGAENISDATIAQCIQWVNMDLARAHSDATAIAQPFQNFFIPSDIKLMLAHTDPNGNCTSGIVRYYDSRTSWNQDANPATLYGGITWNPTRYLNVILVSEIIAPCGSTGGGKIIGYTHIPGTLPTGDLRDAVVYTASYIGKNIIDNRDLTHEIGHWLGLSHTFGNTNNPGISCGDDGICDTPPTKGYFSTCPSSASGNSCAGTATCGYAAGQANVENIMDYSSCPKNFTAGQTNVMRNVLASSVVGRSNVPSAPNLLATGVNASGVCPPMAEFATPEDTYSVCMGGTVTLRSYSYNGTITGTQWSADNSAILSSQTGSTTVLQLSNLGTTNVSLTVTNSLGWNTQVKSFIGIDPTATMWGPWAESFEVDGLPTDWRVDNKVSGSGTWGQSWEAAYDGNGSFKLTGATLLCKDVDALYTPIIDMQSSPVKEMLFSYAYAQSNTQQLDELKVQATTDCGATWLDLLTLGANQMRTGSGEITSTAFVPTPEQWKTVNLATYPTSAANWAGVSNSSNLQVRFAFYEGNNGGGNNFYLDYVSLPDAVGLTELKQALNMTVYPNPSSGKITVKFTNKGSQPVQLSVMDISGRTVLTADTKNSTAEQEVSLNANQQLAPGMYILKVNVDGTQHLEKIVIQ